MTTDNLTPEEIREGNRIVAIYDGMQDKTRPDMFRRRNATHIITIPERLEYHSDWQWMIPAWAKVCKQLRSKTEPVLDYDRSIGSMTLWQTNSGLWNDFQSAVNDDNKPSAFCTLVAAIKLLNEKRNG